MALLKFLYRTTVLADIVLSSSKGHSSAARKARRRRNKNSFLFSWLDAKK
jgi:hypothetical protein